MYLVYLLPLLLIVIVALTIFTGPVIAAIIFVLCLIGLGAYKFLGRGTDPEHARPPKKSMQPASGPGTAASASDSSEEDTGMWGETWPEQREGTS
jgi:hypothetical protein